MNVLIHRYNSICEPGYIDAFKSLGIEVVEDTLEMTEKNIAPEVRVSSIAEMILKNRPMFVFTINFFPYISDICEKLGVMYVCVSVDCPVSELLSVSVRNRVNRIFLFDRKQYEDIAPENPGCVFFLPLGVNPMITAAKQSYKYDVSFIGSLYNEKNPYADMASRLSPRVRGLCDGLLGAQEMLGGMELIETVLGRGRADIERNYAGDLGIDSGIRTEITSEFNKYLPEALKTGPYTVDDITQFWAIHGCLGYELTVRDRLILLSSVAESIEGIASLHLFTGSDTALLKSISSHIVCYGRVNTLTEMPDIFAGSRINLNTTMRPIRTGLPQRIWDVLGCGGFLLTDNREDLPETLIPGRHLETYDSPEEACEKIRYYLEHEDEREEIARNGYEEAVTSHTILKRVISMISAIMDGQETSGGKGGSV